jgi:hypothetical protein
VLVATAISSLQNLRTHLIASLGHRIPAAPPPFDAAPSFQIRHLATHASQSEERRRSGSGGAGWRRR